MLIGRTALPRAVGMGPEELELDGELPEVASSKDGQHIPVCKSLVLCIFFQVPQHSFADGLAVIENRIRDDMLDERLLQLTDYVRNFWMARVGIATLSAFKMVRRTNNSCEIFHTKLLLALGRRKNVWSFVSKYRMI
ncbi:hypothetical protein LSTR_LSTR006992 [Laodelphax striatellus]|uniref:Uncharacterized protein n=1 Tax=Laodelphax striatellus TaxID=195883 RepID=A0A482WJC7_LAOST|nr:hypothetical protein LSTR_LSTR006992 [Laodelphax striatellus]